jgi:hypothetical protein
MVGFFTLGSRAETAENLLGSFPVACILNGTRKRPPQLAASSFDKAGEEVSGLCGEANFDEHPPISLIVPWKDCTHGYPLKTQPFNIAADIQNLSQVAPEAALRTSA